MRSVDDVGASPDRSFVRVRRALRVCLVRPPSVTNLGVEGQNAVPPIGLAYIAGSLVAAGCAVSVVDAVGEAPERYRAIPGVRNAVLQGLTPEEIAERVGDDVDLVGVSCMFSVEWPYDRRVIEAIRARRPGVPIVVGGEHVTACWSYVLQSCPSVDACVLGEGEETIAEIAARIAAGRGLAGLPGCATRETGDGGPPAPRPRNRAIDEIPEPAWDLFPIEQYFGRGLVWGVELGRVMPILASRGCPYQCTFCSAPSMWTTYWAVRDPRRVVAEMKRYMQRYGVRNFGFYDLTAIIRREWIVAFCEALLHEELDVEWQLPSGTRTEAIDAEVAALMHRAGLRYLNYAPESGSPALLRRIKKKIDLDRMLESMRAASAAGLKIKANIMFGFPDETAAEVLQTLRLIPRLALAGAEDMGPYPFSAYPGSEQFRALERAGAVRMDESYFHDLLRATDPRNGISFSPRFTARQLRALVVAAVALFYLVKFSCRPRALGDFLRNIARRRPQSRLQKHILLAKRKQDALLAEHTRLPRLVREVRAWGAVFRGRYGGAVAAAVERGRLSGAPPGTSGAGASVRGRAG